ncbi:MAG: glycosyltransferase family 39 protein [Egibacteraceae bacterium]
MIAALIRFGTLDLQSFWADEAGTVDLLQMSLRGMLGEIPESESTPPLYYLLARGWAELFGTGEVGLRSLSALFGTAAVPVFYAAAAELCSKRVALAVAALAALNPFLVWYSQEARSFALLVLLGALSTWAFARMLSRPGPRAAAAWAAAAALALAAHYFAVFLVAAQAVWLLALPRTRRAAWPGVGAVAVAGLLLLPLALHQRSLELAYWLRYTPLPERAARTVKQFLVGYDAPLEPILMVAAGAIAAAAVGLALLGRHGAPRRGVPFALALGAAATVVPFGLALLGQDYVDARNLIAGLLPFAIVVGAGLTSPRFPRAGSAALVALCSIQAIATLGMLLEPAWHRDDWRAMAGALGPPSAERAIVVQPPGGVGAFRLYRPGAQRIAPAGGQVREVALLAPVARRESRFDVGTPPRGRPPSIPGFRVAERHYADTYTLTVLRSRLPTHVTERGLAAYGLVRGAAATVLIDRR